MKKEKVSIRQSTIKSAEKKSDESNVGKFFFTKSIILLLHLLLI